MAKLKATIKAMEGDSKNVDLLELERKKGELDGLKRAKDVIINVRRFIETGHR